MHSISPDAKVSPRFAWGLWPANRRRWQRHLLPCSALRSQLFLPCSRRCAHFSEVMQWEHVLHGAFDNQWLVHFRMWKTCMCCLLVLWPLPIVMFDWAIQKDVILAAYIPWFIYSCGLNHPSSIFSLFWDFVFSAFSPWNINNIRKRIVLTAQMRSKCPWGFGQAPASSGEGNCSAACWWSCAMPIECCVHYERGVVSLGQPTAVSDMKYDLSYSIIPPTCFQVCSQVAKPYTF